MPSTMRRRELLAGLAATGLAGCGGGELDDASVAVTAGEDGRRTAQATGAAPGSARAVPPLPPMPGTRVVRHGETVRLFGAYGAPQLTRTFLGGAGGAIESQAARRANAQRERIYADPTLRLRYFIEQNYFGNFGQREDGVDNTMPKPQVRELWSDDSRVIVGQAAGSG